MAACLTCGGSGTLPANPSTPVGFDCVVCQRCSGTGIAEPASPKLQQTRYGPEPCRKCKGVAAEPNADHCLRCGHIGLEPEHLPTCICEECAPRTVVRPPRRPTGPAADPIDFAERTARVLHPRRRWNPVAIAFWIVLGIALAWGAAKLL
jgi:hypothetical protein